MRVLSGWGLTCVAHTSGGLCRRDAMPVAQDRAPAGAEEDWDDTGGGGQEQSSTDRGARESPEAQWPELGTRPRAGRTAGTERGGYRARGPGGSGPHLRGGGVAVTFGPRDAPNALVQQRDGTLVVAGISSGDGFGNLFLARYRPDGRVDASFGAGGKVTVRFGTGHPALVAFGSRGKGLVAQPDGTLVLAAPVIVGTSPSGGTPLTDALLVRFLSDSRLDPSFGMGGAVATDLGSNEIPTALLRQPDGALIMAGSSVIINPRNAAAFGTAFLARYQPDGRLDPAFGVGGAVTNFFGSGQLNTSPYVLARQPDGKLVVAGPTFTSPGALVGVLGVARFLALQPQSRKIYGKRVV
jgi:uncharacterized delta-60 repeat protein